MRCTSRVKGGLLVAGIAIHLSAPHLLANDVPGPYRFWNGTSFTGPFATVGNGSSIVGYTGVDDDGNFTGAAAVNATIDNLPPVIANGVFVEGVPSDIEGFNTIHIFNGSIFEQDAGIAYGYVVHDTSVLTLGTGTYTPSGNGAAQAVTGNAVNIQADDNSTVTISAGVVGDSAYGSNAMQHGIEALDSSDIFIEGGSVDFVTGQDNSNITISSGQIKSFLDLSDDSIGIAKGTASIGSVSLQAGSTASFALNGGNVDGAVDAEGGAAYIESGTVGGILIAGGTGSVHMFGGTANNILANANGATAYFSGGTVGGAVQAENAGSVQISGGTCSSVAADDFLSSAVIAGATITGNIEASAGGYLELDSGSVGGNAVINDLGNARIFGGTVTGDLETHGSGTAALNSGTVSGGINTFDTSTVTMAGGATTTTVTANDFSSFYMAGGNVSGPVSIAGAATVQIAGGNVAGAINVPSGNLYVNAPASCGGVNASGGTVDQTGGTVNGDYNISNGSVVDVADSTINGNVNCYNNSLVELTDTTVTGEIQCANSAQVIINGNQISGNNIAAPLALRQSDDTDIANIIMYDNSSLEIDGFDFDSTLLNNNFDDMFSEYAISGYFGDGTPFPANWTILVENDSAADPGGATLSLVEVPPVPIPEPTGLALVVGAVAWSVGGRRVRGSHRRG